MTQIQHRHIPIYKNIIILLGAFVLCGGTLYSAQAIEFGSVQYGKNYIDYSGFDKSAVKKSADSLFNKALKTKDKTKKKELLEKAGGEYFILTKIEPNDLYAINQLARVYDYEGKNSYAKGYFNKALEINKNYAPTHYYFGEYYYSRNEYKKALNYYQTAFKNGYKENHEILIKMATLYEKLGDLVRANQYYKKAFLANKNDTKAADKIRELEAIKYQNTGYYTKHRKN